ncbi:sulfite exporter TauE/SafE family protein [Anthocerotibacter panamensis]|uniref:sulfite exporter TauE/SafE family protein n=1 Tax=Anthocerotibacter panamensis TaxID=2857077 RepID=UPI001C404407|nr:sulfite exporter TauE/SafE family protein [Anthocerotibacter panamensis]
MLFAVFPALAVHGLPWPLVVLIGVGLGLGSGLFGIGGSSIATPVLRLLGLPALIALASPLPLTLPGAIGGALAYQQKGLICWPVVVWTGIWGVPGVLLGAWLTEFLPAQGLMLLTALFVLGVGVYGLTGLKGRQSLEDCPQIQMGVIPYGAMLTGLLSGLLANGGGLLLVPFYRLGVGLGLRSALATSLATVGLLALPGTLVHYYLGHVDWLLTGWLAAGVLPSTYLGSQLALRLPLNFLSRLYSLFLIVLACYFGVTQLQVIGTIASLFKP